MGRGTIVVSMECKDCGCIAFQTIATPEAPFDRSRGRITLPRVMTEHECPAAPTQTQEER